MRHLLLMMLTFFLLISCKKEFTNNTSTVNEFSNTAALGPIISHSVAPNQTDAAITTINNPLQTAYVQTIASFRKDLLYVFIPGTGGAPTPFGEILSAAADSGYYSFGIAFNGQKPIEELAGDNPDDKTVENILEEYLTGNDVSPKVNVTKANSFENRITKMILYLDSLTPGENWHRFLTNDNRLIWRKVSVAGQSQGSDHAMYMSKKRPLNRASFFAGPGGFRLNNGDYPTFIRTAAITPIEKIYGFAHKNDSTRLWKDVKKTWEILGILGALDNVDKGPLDTTTHKFITSVDVAIPHVSLASSVQTPKDENGNPIFEPIWSLMGFPD